MPNTYTPYGVPDSSMTGFAFTGEQRDTNGLQYHRARYYNAGLGTWASLDPFEGIHDRPMSLNGYAWVEGNVMNGIDPSGLIDPLTLVLLIAGCGVIIASGGSVPVNNQPPVLASGTCKMFLKGQGGATGRVWEEAFPLVVDSQSTKLEQKDAAVRLTTNCTEIYAVGYSAGGDALIMFSKDNIDRIKGIALLAPTLSGAPDDTVYNVSAIWVSVFLELTRQQKKVYFLDDRTTEAVEIINEIVMPISAPIFGSTYFKYVYNQLRSHEGNRYIDGNATNNDPVLVADVNKWFGI
jgi:RHS repeat-associated protein